MNVSLMTEVKLCEAPESSRQIQKNPRFVKHLKCIINVNYWLVILHVLHDVTLTLMTRLVVALT